MKTRCLLIEVISKATERDHITIAKAIIQNDAEFKDYVDCTWAGIPEDCGRTLCECICK